MFSILHSQKCVLKRANDLGITRRKAKRPVTDWRGSTALLFAET
jgi:hypothetical protein